MFGFGGRSKLRPERKLEEFPSFGPVAARSHARGPLLLLAGALLFASLCTGASLTLADGAKAGALRIDERQHAPAALPTGCDGAWGNEPLDCLLQTA